MRVMAAVGFVAAVSLACGGVSIAPKGSERAQDMGEYLAAERGIDCPVYELGDQIEWGDNLQVVVQSAEHGVPQDIPSGLYENQEKGWIAEEDGTVMTVRFEVTNTSPVTQDAEFGFSLKPTPPAEAFWLRQHTRYLAESDPSLDPTTADDAIVPGDSVSLAEVWTVKPSGVPNALIVMEEEEERIDPEDPRGRYREFPVRCAVVDLGLAPEGA